GQHAADVERFAQNMAHHVLREDALRGILIMQTPGGVNVMIAGIPAEGGRVDPALQAKGGGLRLAFHHLKGLALYAIFRPAANTDPIVARRQLDFLAVGAVDLWMKGEVRRQSFRRRGIYVPLRVANDEEAG